MARAGIFATRIVDVKNSRGKCFVVAPGLLNAFLRPALAGLLEGPLALASAGRGPLEPLWSGPGACLPKIWGQAAPARRVSICGNLCTALDMACQDVLLADVLPGNVLYFENAGAYGAGLSPGAFAGHGPAAEVVI